MCFQEKFVLIIMKCNGYFIGINIYGNKILSWISAQIYATQIGNKGTVFQQQLRLPKLQSVIYLAILNMAKKKQERKKWNLGEI